MSFQKILSKCQKGEGRYQEKLYKLFYGYAKSICLRYAKNEDDACELLNDAFLSVFNNLMQFDSEREFKPWLRKIVVNKCIDKYKKRVPVDIADIELASEVPQIDNALNQLDAEAIIDLLQQLPHNLRVTFNLYEVEGYDHNEIAEKLEISPSSSRSNLTRAKLRLRQIIQKKPEYAQLERYSY